MKSLINKDRTDKGRRCRWPQKLSFTTLRKQKHKVLAYCIWICLFFVLLLPACSQKTLYNNGDYFGESEGYYSNIKVRVTISGGKISEITILEHNEPEILATVVFDKLPAMIIKKNSAEVDIISGASYTSKSLIEAVENALKTARK